jgi:GntR family transcriptional repressor for pyruvate dehydrogenase complex
MTTRKKDLFKFQSVRQASVVDQIIENFKQALVHGEIKRGQRLPSEAELCDQFGVGRSAIREAMKILQALGVVTIQQGNGTYIVDQSSPSMLNPLVFAIMLEAGMSTDLVELRRLMEIGYCELAAYHATEEDWSHIEQAAQAHADYARAPDPEVGELVRLDLEFHRTILEASHNSLVINLGHAIEELFFASMHNTYVAVADNLDKSVCFHREIVNAIRDKDPIKIHQAVESSLIHWKEEVKKLGTSIEDSST